MSPKENTDEALQQPSVLTPTADQWLEVVQHQVDSLKFGSVHITVHEGRVVQVETSVRVRFDKAS